MRRFVSQFGHQETVDQVFLASDKQLRPNRAGNLYLQVELSDRSGSIGARMWNASESDLRAFENGDYVHVDGTTQLFQGAIQMIVSTLRRVSASDVNLEDFVILDSKQVDRLLGKLREQITKIHDPHLRTLIDCFLVDQEFMRKFTKAPAGIKNHHAYAGGLLEHVVQLIDVVIRVAPAYPELSSDLLIAGAFLHDIGKVDELTYERDLAYSDNGQLIGHLVIGVELLNEKLREAERLAGEVIPAETILRLKHMIVSHHGQYEFGSPKLPMTLEAVALHCLDNLDAKLHSFLQLMRDDPNVESSWTAYYANLGRKLFKGAAGTDG
jgi:3'-5' exoribonuclease